ncbi:MAG TPA: hypothetical protein VG994_17760 [Steroidobacteraceae bacterium]|nr:hypothetical protein [Steroidobacteraceae bacterium]
MTYIELPRALEDYFAYAEIDPTRHGRRFTINLPYFDGNRLDRLQWWYHVSPDQEARHGDAILATLRAQAVQRFRKHIERWLQNTGQKLYGDEPIPRIARLDALPAQSASSPAEPPPEPAEPVAEPETNVVSWPADKVANG